MVVAAALADIAGHVDVGQEMHLHPDLAVAAAGLAAAAAHVEAEASGLVAALAGVGGHGEDVADLVEDLGVGGRVGTRRAADGRLVDGHDALDGAGPLAVAQAGDGAGLVHALAQADGQMLVQRVHHQRALARTGHARDTGQHAQREAAVDAAQVVGGHVVQGQPALGLTPFVGQAEAGVAAQIAGREGIGAQQFGHAALEHDLAALGAGTGPQFDDRVGRADGGLVVLHHQHGIAALLQGTQGAQQAFVVTRVQADGRLVQHIGHAHQTGAQLGGQTDALGLAAGKGGHGPAQGKIFQAHVAHEGQTVGQLLEQGLGHQGVAAVEVPSFQPLQGTFHGKGTELGDVQVVHAHGQGLGLETGAVAVRAVRGLAEAGQDLAPGLAVLHAFFQQRDDAGPALLADLHVGGASGKKFALVVARGIHGHVAAHPVAAQAAAVRGGAALFVLAVEQAGQGRVGKVLQRRGEREAVALAQGAQGGLVTLEVFALGPG